MEKKNITIAFYPTSSFGRREFDYDNHKGIVEKLRTIRDEVILSYWEDYIENAHNFVELFNDGLDEYDEQDYVAANIKELTGEDDVWTFESQYWAVVLDADYQTAIKDIKGESPIKEDKSNNLALYKALIDDIVAVTKGGNNIELIANENGSYTLKYNGIVKTICFDE